MPRTSSRRDTEPRYSNADLEPLLKALAAMHDGDFRPMAGRQTQGDGALGEAALLLEGIREQNRQLFSELARVHRGIGREGRLNERLAPAVGEGAWAAGVDSANAALEALTA